MSGRSSHNSGNRALRLKDLVVLAIYTIISHEIESHHPCIFLDEVHFLVRRFLDENANRPSQAIRGALEKRTLVDLVMKYICSEGPFEADLHEGTGGYWRFNRDALPKIDGLKMSILNKEQVHACWEDFQTWHEQYEEKHRALAASA